MKPPVDRKLFLGPKLRLLRRELGVNQTQMAEELGVSPSYLNHLERNQRPLTAQMLLRLANTYDLDIREFVSGASPITAGNLLEIFSDALVREIGVPRDEVNEIAENYPGVAEVITRFYRALTDLRRLPDVMERVAGVGKTSSALEWLRGFVHDNNNHFVRLEEAAQDLSSDWPEDPAELYVAMRRSLESDHGISVRIVADKAMAGGRRFYDLHRRRLMIAERLPASSRLFAIAFQMAMTALHHPISAIIEQSHCDDETRPLLRTLLTNYTAAALLMPYSRFVKAAEETRYDMDLLQARFGVSFEQAAQRLTTLSRNGEKAVPFFLLKVDIAGTVSKRFAKEGMPLAQFGGGCPRWSLYRTFHLPGRNVAEIVEMPGGQRYVTFSRAVAHSLDPDARSIQAIAVGCDIKYAPRLKIADGLAPDAANLIGPACHVCERAHCPDRALPPVTRSLAVNQYQRGNTPYPFHSV
jgi:predicted transcriptional regulator/transcriptional regulator with XRE-family HTH domain